MEPRLPDLSPAADAIDTAAQAQARAVAAFPDADHLFARVSGLDADCRPVDRRAARGVSIPDVTYSLVSHPVYASVVNSWAILLFVVGIPLCVASYVRTLWSSGMKRSLPLVLLLPVYWTFIGFAATCSFFKDTQSWGRTER